MIMSLISKEITPEKALNDYLDSIYLLSHSESSKKAYRSFIKNDQSGFRKFLKDSFNCDEIQLAFRIENKELDVYQVLNKYVVYLDKNEIKPRGIKSALSCVKGYLTSMGIEVYSEKCKQLIKLPKIRKVKKEPLTKEILIKLLHVLPVKLRTAVLIAVSSGMRIGEIAEMTIEDIEFNSDPVSINIRAETTKTREERDTFISKEASEALRDYLTRFFGWREDKQNKNLLGRKIFGRTSKTTNKMEFSLSEQKRNAGLLQTTLYRSIENIPELFKFNKEGRKIIHFHAFRDFFYTQVSTISGSNFAHALMGHGEYLDTYYVLASKQKISLYKKAEPYITISDYSKIEKDLEKIQEQNSDILDQYQKLERYLRQKDPSFPKFLEMLKEDSLN